MAITIGTKLGFHEITALLGKGGMGEVYRARDTKLKRDVAIKILPDEFLRDAGRLTRFQREAEVLASLNHPNIAAIYDFQEANDTRFLVLELVEGETLAERIERGPIPVDEALEIAKHICEALEAAHEKGVVHRDLKPANVKIAADGRVKVLDFGLAKAMSGANASPAGRSHQVMENSPAPGTMSNSPTLSLAATQAGMILGTAAYMSPEQAKGFEVDARSDTFSFGSVLYEMLSGRQAFQGDTVAEILASVLVRDPDFSLLPQNLNPRIQELLQRCFQKNPKRRWQAAGDLRAELEIIAKAPSAVAMAASAATVPRQPLWKRAIPILLTAILFSTLAGIVAWNLKPAPPALVSRFSVVLPESQNFTRTRSQLAAISPDGSMLVYVANRQLYLRRMAEQEAQPIPGTQEDVSSPFFSPDGRWIGFYSFQEGAVKKIAVTGGAAVTLCTACANTLAYGMSWEGDTIAFARDGREIVEMPQTGGDPKVWVKAGTDERISSPHFLGADRLMFSSLKGATRWEKADIVVLSRQSGQRKVVMQGGNGAHYVNTGHIVYSIGTNLLAVPFDIRQLKTTGDPVSIVAGTVLRSLAFEDGPANFDVSQNGTLVYAAGSPSIGDMLRVLTVIDKTGRASAVPGLPPGSYATPRVSADGKYLAVETTDDGAISIYELSGKSQLRRLTLEGINANPVWSPDGKRIAFRSIREGKIGVFVQNSDGTGSPEQLTTASSQGYPFSWSPDGNYIEFVRDNRTWTIALSGERKITALTEGQTSVGGQFNAAFSPDGHWVALASTESRPPGLRIYLQQFPTGARYQISRELANAPIWSHDGKELFYYQTDTRKLVSVRIQTQPSVSFSEPVVFPVDLMIQAEGGIRQYDVLPDGRLLVLKPTAQQDGTEQRSQQRINVVLNWFEELKQRVPSKP